MQSQARGAVAPPPVESRLSRGVLRTGVLVDPAHTVKACDGLGQNVRAGSPGTAGTSIGWPSGSRGEWVRRLPCYRLSCNAGLWLSPTGVACQLPWLAAWPQVARAPSRQVVSTAARCALTPEVVELPAVPPLGQLGVLAPLRPLGLGSPWYFRTPALLRGFPRGVSVRFRLAFGRPRLGGG